jgi:prepilin signal peptidase PulO-like enzyme (type II secretory pathway)
MKVNCTTMTFMLGIIVGALIHTENSLLNVVSSILLATVVFHFTTIKDFKFIKKGS